MIILKNNKLKEIPYNQENIDKYKSKDNLLRHARYIKGLTNGIFLLDNSNNLVGYIAWEKDTIIALEVISDYRNNGIATKLISKAVDNGVNKLTVRKNNINAINLYKNLGWKIDKETDKIYFMKLK